MKTIWKFPLRETAFQDLPVPDGSKILKVGQDPGGKLCAWVLLDTNNQIGNHAVTIVGTGHDAPENKNYLGTVNSGQFVWHIFD